MEDVHQGRSLSRVSQEWTKTKKKKKKKEKKKKKSKKKEMVTESMLKKTLIVS